MTFLTDRLSIRFAGDLNESEVQTGPLFESTSAGLTSGKGNELLQAPGYSASLAVDYVFPIMANWNLTLHADHAWVDGHFVDAGNTTEVPKWTKANASVTARSDDGKWRIALFGSNITGEEILRDWQGSAGLRSFGMHTAAGRAGSRLQPECDSRTGVRRDLTGNPRPRRLRRGFFFARLRPLIGTAAVPEDAWCPTGQAFARQPPSPVASSVTSTTRGESTGCSVRGGHDSGSSPIRRSRRTCAVMASGPAHGRGPAVRFRDHRGDHRHRDLSLVLDEPDGHRPVASMPSYGRFRRGRGRSRAWRTSSDDRCRGLNMTG